MKTCPKCKGPAAGGLASMCKPCGIAYGRAWRANPETKAKRKAAKLLRIPQDRDGHLRRKYGISLETYNLMLAGQGNRCAICRTLLPGGHGTHTDHDHSTGKVRGLLCAGCNIGLGGFKDSQEALSLAIQYLERNS